MLFVALVLTLNSMANTSFTFSPSGQGSWDGSGQHESVNMILPLLLALSAAPRLSVFRADVKLGQCVLHSAVSGNISGTGRKSGRG